MAEEKVLKDYTFYGADQDEVKGRINKLLDTVMQSGRVGPEDIKHVCAMVVRDNDPPLPELRYGFRVSFLY